MPRVQLYMEAAPPMELFLLKPKKRGRVNFNLIYLPMIITIQKWLLPAKAQSMQWPGGFMRLSILQRNRVNAPTIEKPFTGIPLFKQIKPERPRLSFLTPMPLPPSGLLPRALVIMEKQAVPNIPILP